MARNRSVDFLPEIFKTDTNKEFLSSTLDQLTQQPKLKQTQGYVGRKYGHGIDSDDSYVLEPTVERSNYQLEPGIVFKDGNNGVDEVITYPELLDVLRTKGADVSKHDRLFSSPIYSWSPLIDFDKFINHSQYYWLPGGVDSVDVSATDVLLTDNFNVSMGVNNTYEISGTSGLNPSITLVRGGEYTFTTNQTGNNFYIQTAPGINGVVSYANNISSRDVVGVTNNGDDNGVITFAVPEVDAQQFYYDLTEIDSIDLATFSRFDSINGKLVSSLGSIDSVVDLEGKTIVFLDTTSGDSADLGWQYLDLHEDAPFESEPFEETVFIDSQTDRYSVYQITYTVSGGESIIKLVKIKEIANHEKFDIGYGAVYSSKSFYKNSSGFFQEIPLLTASQDTLYYQDGVDSTRFGVINLIDSSGDPKLNIGNITNEVTYTSPNGIEFTNGIKVIFRGNVTPSEYEDTEYYVEGVGTSIKLIKVSDLITPETFNFSVLEPFDLHGFDSTNFDSDLNSPTTMDFVTINRASDDLNPWSRSNRWVHIDVIKKAAEYNKADVVLDNNFRASRPIIEFNAGLRLYNFGTESKIPVTVIDFDETDALSNVNGSLSFTIDSFNITEGTRVIFANDTNKDVRNKIYDVYFVDLLDDGNLVVNLEEASDAIVLVDQNVVCTNGLTLQGKVYHFNGSTWVESQQKTSVNQAPLFDVFDLNGLSFSNSSGYPYTKFNGTKMFSYAIGTGVNDTVLGFPLQYLNIDNLGDIVFDNNLYKDTFMYKFVATSKKVSDGFIRKYKTRTTYNSEVGWTKFIHDTTQTQIFNFDFDGESLILDILPKGDLYIPSIKVFVDGAFINSKKYTVTLGEDRTVIEFIDSVSVGTKIEVSIISDTSSNVGYYEIPKNLENNVLNENVTTLTLGTIRNHCNKMAQNMLTLIGDANGANNLRDLGKIDKYGDLIIQNSSPVAPMAKFLHSQEFDFFKSLEFNANSYERYKLKIIDYVSKNDTYGLDASTILNNALEFINVGKSSISPFYNNDMLGGSRTPTKTTTHYVTSISTDTFNTVDIYDFTKANNASLLVYLNDVILLKDIDYEVSIDSATIKVILSLTDGDIVEILEYESTIGTYIPNTPTKLGLYPKFQPKKYNDNTYITPVDVIQGHDGSKTVAFGDVRDDVLLEFESRIYNNIKIDSIIPIRDVDVIPGKFRTTEYDDAITTNILSNDFLNWVGWNRLDYKTQDYLADNEWSWNYSTSSSKLDGTAIKGHWRGVYKDYYDTDTPHTTPWEMLGLSEKPAWWEDEYGPLPYTNGNLVLWDDLESGLIKTPNANKVDDRYKRPGLTEVIPVDSTGKLINPFISIVQNYSQSDFRKSWVIGDCGPTENAWRRSSSYPYALQRLFALTKPAQYFSLSIDRDRYVFDESINHYLYDSRYGLDVRNVEIQSNTTPKHSYINWITDYHNNNGCSCIDITNQLKEIDVRLCYRMASFSDKSYLKIFTDKSSPHSTNTGLLLPDQSYELILHKNEPLSELQYSSVIVQKTDDGYSVYGYGSTQQYFEILQSINNSNYDDIGNGIRLPKDFNNVVTVVPYGYVFTNKDSVIDFLASYGAFLKLYGLVFETTENSNTLDWGKMTQEFLNWTTQGWGTGSIINLNPGAISLEFNKELVIVDDISSLTNHVLDQNGVPLEPSDYVITRLDNSFKISTINNKSINFLKIKTTSYEHLLVLDNESIFSDLLYKPVTGLRQHRIRLVGFSTFEWNGQLDAQGFILNQDNIKNWESNKFYTTGNIVKFKDLYWSAVSKLNPTETFDFNDWVEIDYSNIKTGLLPNISNKAGQIGEYYNKKTANLESDVDLLAMGLTGFRPRTYLNSLDDVSQVNFYTDFVSNKGTNSSANVFRNVKFNKKVTDYKIFENWAVLESTYGGSGNRAFIDLVVKDDKLQNNPSIVEIIDNDTTKESNHELIKLSDIHRQNETHVSSNIFPTIEKENNIKLPIAGNVYTNDVDIALFQLSDLNGAAGIPFISQLSSGSLIWVAKDNSYDWNVYRVDTQSNIKSVIPVDGKTQITFYTSHTLVVSDTVVIQGMNLNINGGYKVFDVISSTVIILDIVVSGTYVNISTDSSITTDTLLYTADHMFGFVYKLTSVRIENETDLNNSYIDQLPIGARVWMDTNRNGKYATYQKYNQLSDITSDDISILADSAIYTTDGYGVWAILREEQDTVNNDLIKYVSIYNKNTNKTKLSLDYIDPINGKLLGIVNENIDYIGAINPASYNSHDSGAIGVMWGDSHLGEIWWDTSNVRFINYIQDDLIYSSNNWGSLFPGSTVDIRQWVKSSKHPSQYNGTGTVVDETNFTTISNIDYSNTIVQYYYFWVSNVNAVRENKSLSVDSIKQYIDNPISSGISYVAFLNSSTVAIYNSQTHFTDESSVLHISYSHMYSENSVFNEYRLIREDNEDGFLSDIMYKKLQDSFVGGNSLGLAVPDISLGFAERLGTSFRPRQSLFDNRLNALKSYLTQVNDLLKKHIISYNKSFKLLTTAEAEPKSTSGEWDFKVSNLSELNHQNISTVPEGYKYLVSADTDNNGGWSIYEVSSSKLLLIRIQKYDTSRAWTYINWYQDSDAENAIPQHIVSDSSKLVTLTVDDNTYAKVLSNSIGKFEIYQLLSGSWVRVGLEDGTIKFNDSLWSGESTQDNITVDTLLFTADSYVNSADEGTGGVELRNVIRSINEELLTNELAIDRNKLIISLFRYILSEQSDVGWLHKTSLIDVEHTVRDLEQYPTFKKDDQDFLLNYLTESKPYHTKIKEFLLKYNGNDQYNTDTIDFDVPAYYDTTFGKFISPVLDYDGVILKTDQSNFDDDGKGLKETGYNIWELTPWDSWYTNRGLSIGSVVIQNSGSGYISAPTVIVSGGGATTQATMISRINTVGKVIGIDILTGGDGYTSEPTITLSGGNGQGVVLTSIMTNPLVRNVLTTIRYDRCEYNTSVVDWVNDMTLTTVDSDLSTIDSSITVDSGLYEVGKLVRFNNKLYVLNVLKSFETSFDINDYTLIDSPTMEYIYDNDNNKYVSPVPSNAVYPQYGITQRVSGADRTMGYYVPDIDKPGLDIGLLINGTTYHGVSINGLDMTSSDTVDVEYSSSFSNLYLGTNPSDINPDGGLFIDEYSSHSPEELIPGSVFDTLDMVINTRPGFDYDGNGHAFEMQYKLFEYTSSTTVFSFIDIVEHPISIKVINSTNGLVLSETNNYTVDWANGTVSITSGVTNGETIQIYVYEIGGGNQLFRETYNGTDILNEVQIPVESSSIYNILIHVNGSILSSGFTATSDGKVTVDSILETVDSDILTADIVSSDTRNTTTITFTSTYTSSDFIVISVFGFESTQHEYSYPETKSFTGIGASYNLIYGSNGINIDNKNRQNALIYHNGIRLRPPEAKRYIGDSTLTDFRLPEVGLINHSLVSTSEIVVYIDNEVQTLSTDYVVTTVVVGADTFKDISFTTAPPIGSKVDVYVITNSDYTIDTSSLIIKSHITVTPTSAISATTWNDTSEIDITTSVFVGPTHTTTLVVELFDSFGFDMELFDYIGNAAGTVNLFDLRRTITNGNRLVVTKNGKSLLSGVDYVVSDTALLITGDLISPIDVIAVTSVTDGTVPEELSFRLFKDMNGSSAMYRIDNSVTLTKDVADTDEKIYVNNVSKLTEPNLGLGIFGIAIVNGERITYRERNTVDNTIGGLRRGTAGTGIANHTKNSIVNDVSVGTSVTGSVITSTTLGSDTNETSTTYDKIWYATGNDTASNGVALQDQITAQANFVKN